MYKIIVFGTGSTSELVITGLNDRCKIIAYADNNSNKWGTIDGISIINPDKIAELEFDYIIIASQYNDEIFSQLIKLGIDNEKILQFFKIIDYEYNFLKAALETEIKASSLYEVIATGISYCKAGLNESLLCKHCINLAFGSQDIYYDYHIMNFLLERYYETYKSLKYCIIGLSYYSFEYDMSLSAMKNKVIMYYEVLGLSHHNTDIKKKFEEYIFSKQIADKVFRVNGLGKYEFVCYPKVLVESTNKEQLGFEQAKIDCNKNYPMTVRENKNILREYLLLLKRYGIKPIIVVFPASKYYTKCFSERIESEFHSIIDEIRKDFDVQYIDYFRSEYFTDEDFSDVSHLNSEGAKKFTEILNNIIKW